MPARLKGANELEALFRDMRKGFPAKLKVLLASIGDQWVREAKRRVPVDTGRLRNSITKRVRSQPGGASVAVGSNVFYAPFIEFGTDGIAGGRVKALGTSAEISDAQAITDWPAKTARNATAQQMPWLRPAYNKIKPVAFAAIESLVQSAARG